MSKVWKLGTRWSEWGSFSSSVLSIMRRNNTAFVWLKGQSKKDFLNITKGQYIALADGYQIVAIGKTTGNACYLKDFRNFSVSDYDYSGFSLEDGIENIVAVRVNIVDIDEADRKKFIYQKCHRFCRLYQKEEFVKRYYEEHVNRFEIKSYTATIGRSSGVNYALINPKVTYIIPVYQRPYEWTDKQVKPFINDILSYYMGKDARGEVHEPMFIGTMQLSKRKPVSNNEYQHDVVDGQQRITTLTLFLKELQRHYPSNQFLSDLDFRWLTTHVSKQQNEYLNKYLLTGDEDALNPYSRNARVIFDTFEDFIQNQDETTEFNIDNFCEYLCKQVCLVVIETSAGLSRTIHIFNTINNTGLDLNGSDLFKIRMYEYLKDVKFEDEGVFEKIQNVYNMVDVLNKKLNANFHMGTMLDIYKNILITEYKLNNVLYAFSWETFFERLFDSVLGINEFEYFKNLNGLELSLETLQEVIEMRYRKYEVRYQHFETKFASKMISSFSRYRMSKGLVINTFLYFYRNEDKVYEQLEMLLVTLNKYFFIYSIEYSKQIHKVNSFIAQLVKSMKIKTSNEIIEKIDYQIRLADENLFKESIGRDIINGSKWWRYLVCGMSTYLEERPYNMQDSNLIDKIFKTSDFDIEHIHATADLSQVVPEQLQNSIGNLTNLECKINRSIKDASYHEKREKYINSNYLFIKRIADGYEEWNIENIKTRREEEINKIYSYIKNEQALSFKIIP